VRRALGAIPLQRGKKKVLPAGHSSKKGGGRGTSLLEPRDTEKEEGGRELLPSGSGEERTPFPLAKGKRGNRLTSSRWFGRNRRRGRSFVYLLGKGEVVLDCT